MVLSMTLSTFVFMYPLEPCVKKKKKNIVYSFAGTTSFSCAMFDDICFGAYFHHEGFC